MLRLPELGDLLFREHELMALYSRLRDVLLARSVETREAGEVITELAAGARGDDGENLQH